MANNHAIHKPMAYRTEKPFHGKDEFLKQNHVVVNLCSLLLGKPLCHIN